LRSSSNNSPIVSSPERIDPKKPEYDIRADVWSLGITLVELATAAYPYKDCKTDFEVLTKVLDSDPPKLPDDQGFSEEFKDFVKCCLTKDYRHRPKYHQLLEHPFLKYNERHLHAGNVAAEWLYSIAHEAGISLPNQELASTMTTTTTTTTATSTAMTVPQLHNR